MRQRIEYGIYCDSTLVYVGVTRNPQGLVKHISQANISGKLSNAQMLVRVVLSLGRVLSGQVLARPASPKECLRGSDYLVSSARMNMLRHMNPDMLARLNLWEQGRSELEVDAMTISPEWANNVWRAEHMSYYTLSRLSESLGPH